MDTDSLHLCNCQSHVGWLTRHQECRSNLGRIMKTGLLVLFYIVWLFIFIVICCCLFGCTGCLRKKYGVADFQYLKNGHVQQCNLFKYNKYNFYLDMCKVSTPYVKHNLSYKHEKKDGSNAT